MIEFRIKQIITNLKMSSNNEKFRFQFELTLVLLHFARTLLNIILCIN